MTKEVSLILGFSMSSIMGLYGQSFAGPDTVSVQSGELTLKGLVWRPVGNGRFPAIVFCHGSYGGSDTVHDPLREASLLGPVFANKGYVILVLFRTALITAVEKTSLPIMLIHAENDYSLNPGRSLDSAMNRLHKTHVLKIYPKFGSSVNEGHNLVFGD